MTTKQTQKHVGKTETRQKYKQSKKQNNQEKYKAPLTQSKQSKRQRKQKRQQEQRAKRKPRRRVFPIWLRLIVIFILCVLGLLGGLMVGYGILGDGSPADALKWETWTHIIDIVNKTD